VRSLAHAQGQTMGRTFQVGCDAWRGDSRCGIDLENAAEKGSGTQNDLVHDRAFLASDFFGFAEGWFAPGIGRHH